MNRLFSPSRVLRCGKSKLRTLRINLNQTRQIQKQATTFRGFNRRKGRIVYRRTAQTFVQRRETTEKTESTQTKAFVDDEDENNVKPQKERSALYKFLHKDNIIAKPGFNRWLMPGASVGIHLCIGSVYAWSIFNPYLTKELGVLASAANDWELTSVVAIFSVAIVNLGLSASVAGKWLETVGPRMCGVVAANLWGGGFMLGGLGIMNHQLELLYLGYGVLGGWGLGLGYVTPVSTLIRWFPDRRGMATGMAIMGFGGGALVAAPMKEYLMAKNFVPPTFLGSTGNVQLMTDETGKRLAQHNGTWQEVIVADAATLKPFPGNLQEGVYLVGTGNTGAATTFFTLGALYWSVMNLAAFSFRVPDQNWSVDGAVGTSPEDKEKKETQLQLQKQPSVHIDTALLTPQFYLLWTVLCLNVTAGIGVIGVAKTMMSDIFGSQLDIVDVKFCASYVMAISVFNMLGRFVWASSSDYLGRKNTYNVFFLTQIPLYLSIPMAAEMVSADPSTVPLAMFMSSTLVIFSMYGGGFSTIPAYLADVFGTKYVGGIHGRLLTAWSVAGIAGPQAITQLRQAESTKAIKDLALHVPAEKFENTFGTNMDSIDKLIEAKSISINQLLDLCPDGVIDPTPSLYNTTMYSMSALLVVALGANNAIRPVNPKYHLKEL